MISYEPFEYDWRLKSITDEETGERVYHTPDGSFPSVTTVIGSTSDKSDLEKWRQRVGPEKADRITKQSARWGTDVHAFIEERIKTGKEPKAVFHVQGAWRELRDEFERNLSIVHGVEVPLWSKLLGVAGTADCFGYWNGIPSIIDFKTSRSTKKKEWIKGYFIQCTMYSVMVQQLFNFKVKQIVIPIFSLSGESRIFTCGVSDYLESTRRVLADYRQKRATLSS